MKSNSSIAPEYLDLRAVSTYTCLSVSYWRNVLKRPDAPPVIRLPGKILIKKTDVDTWLEQHRQASIDLDALVSEIIKGL